MNFLMQRLVAYAAKRLVEPSTWIGLIAAGAAAVGTQLTPELQADLANAAVYICAALLVVLREGRNKPDNPSLSTVVRGTMPDPKPAVVPPSDAGLRPVAANQTLAADPAGVVHAEPVAPVLKDPDGHTPVRPGFGKY